VIVGDGPLRDRVPQAVGFVPPSAMGAYYERAAVVCVPSRREGYGMTAREAMAYGRPVVTSGVGGLADLDDASLTVAPGELRSWLARLLGDGGARRTLGERARAFALAELSLQAASSELYEAYSGALRQGGPKKAPLS
jgi:glycosyltransferase involved in cell wall biosynthesis